MRRNDVLISYSVRDKRRADALCAGLEGRGVGVWIAPRNVPLGRLYAAAIIEAIERSKVMVMLFSGSSNKSGHVKREVERAASKGVPIIPVRLSGARMSKTLEFFLSTAQWLEASGRSDQEIVDRLAETLAAQYGIRVKKKNGRTARGRRKLGLSGRLRRWLKRSRLVWERRGLAGLFALTQRPAVELWAGLLSLPRKRLAAAGAVALVVFSAGAFAVVQSGLLDDGSEARAAARPARQASVLRVNGLEFEGRDNGKDITYEMAVERCGSLGAGWRLPTRKDLKLLRASGERPSLSAHHLWAQATTFGAKLFDIRSGRSLRAKESNDPRALCVRSG